MSKLCQHFRIKGPGIRCVAGYPLNRIKQNLTAYRQDNEYANYVLCLDTDTVTFYMVSLYKEDQETLELSLEEWMWIAKNRNAIQALVGSNQPEVVEWMEGGGFIDGERATKSCLCAKYEVYQHIIPNTQPPIKREFRQIILQRYTVRLVGNRPSYTRDTDEHTCAKLTLHEWDQLKDYWDEIDQFLNSPDYICGLKRARRAELKMLLKSRVDQGLPTPSEDVLQRIIGERFPYQMQMGAIAISPQAPLIEVSLINL